MTGWDEAIESTTADFIERLEQRGFAWDGERLTGTMPADPAPVPVCIELGANFPFTPPVVSPPDDFPRSWHRELDGAMCLYPTDGRENLPWLDIDDFLETVGRWLRESVTGWTGDMPDLDLDRYFTQVADEPLVVYGDLDPVTNRFIQLRRQGPITRVVGLGAIPKGTKGLKKNRAFGYVASIGQPETPPACWDDLTAMLPADDVQKIESAVRQRRLSFLILRYERGGVDAAVALRVWESKSGTIELAAVRSASEAPATLALRAGYSAGDLSGSRVVVVGAGAIGSFLCDLLARSCVGAITVYDPDLVRPGNLIRHVAGEVAIGISKPEAVKRLIESRPFNSSTVIAIADAAPGPEGVLTLFADSDLVIDASAAGGTTDMLARAATSGGHHLLSVCLQEEGRVVRIDVIPPLQGEAIPPTQLGPKPASGELRFEAGCGDPVSQTPPYAVLEAASLAARCAVGMLTGKPTCLAGIVRDYR
jgi:hypothetical protein